MNILKGTYLYNDQFTPSEPKHNWVAPCKPAPCDYFVMIFQVAQNQLEFGMSTLFVLKRRPCVFKNAEKYGQNCVKFNPPFSVRLQTT